MKQPLTGLSAGRERRTSYEIWRHIRIQTAVVGWSPLNKLSAQPFEETLTEKMKDVNIVMGATIAIVVAIAIPAAVGISLAIDSTFDAERDRLKENIDAVSSEIQSETAEPGSLEDSFSKGSIWDNASAFIGNAVDSIAKLPSSTLNNITAKFKVALENLMLLLVQWIITACVIPILTLIGFGFIIKILFGLDINSKLGIAASAMKAKTSSTIKTSSTMLKSDKMEDVE